MARNLPPGIEEESAKLNLNAPASSSGLLFVTIFLTVTMLTV